jgi:hypothetical protein
MESSPDKVEEADVSPALIERDHPLRDGTAVPDAKVADPQSSWPRGERGAVLDQRRFRAIVDEVTQQPCPEQHVRRDEIAGEHADGQRQSPGEDGEDPLPPGPRIPSLPLIHRFILGPNPGSPRCGPVERR